MPLLPAVLSLVPLLCLPASSGAERPAALPPALDSEVQDAALLVPDGAFLTVRFESAEKLLGLVQALGSIWGDGAPADVNALMTAMNVPGDLTQVDPARPALLAFALVGMNPLATVVLPTRDPQAFAASVAPESKMQSIVSGSYVGLSMSPAYALRSEPNPVVLGLRPGLVSTHLDLGGLIQTYRPMLEMGLEQVEAMMDQSADLDDSPVDMGPVLELYMDGIWAFIDSAQGLDVALAYDGDSLDLRGDLSTKPKSPMAGFGGEQRYDLSQAARLLDPEAGLCMLAACDWTRTMEQYGPVLEALLDVYPPELAEDMRRFMEAYRETLPLLGPYVAASGDLGPGGMRFAYGLPSSEPAKLATSLNGLLEGLAADPANTALKLSRLEGVEVGGVQALRTHLSFDSDSLFSGLASQSDADEQQQEMFQSMLTAMYGANGMDITVGAKADRVIMVGGGDSAFAERSFARGPTRLEDLPRDLQRAVAAASGGSTAFVYRVDYGQLMSQMGPVFDALDAELGVFAGLGGSFPVTAWMSIHGTTWSGGMGLDVQRLVALSEAFKAAVQEQPQVYEVK